MKVVKQSIGSIVSILLLVSPVMADDNSVVKKVGDGAKTVAKGVSEGTATVGKSVAQGTAKVGKEVGEGAIAVTKTVGKGAKQIGKEVVDVAKGAKDLLFNPVIVTASRVEQHPTDITRTIEVISQDDIEASGVTTLPDLIRNHTGINVSKYLGHQKFSVVDVRGFGETMPSNVLVLIDGRRINQIDLSGPDWAQIDLNTIDHIEIVKGPSTVLYGDNANGGVINIITKTGQQRRPSASATAAIGSYDTRYVAGNVGGAYDWMDYFFSYAHNTADNYRVNSEYWSNDYFAKISLYPTDFFQTVVSGGYHYDKYGMPGALYPQDIEQGAVRASRYDEDNGRTSDYFVTVDPSFSFNTKNHTFDISFFNSFRHRNTKGLNIYKQFGPGFEYETVHHIKTYDLTPKIEWVFEGDVLDNILVSGIDFHHVQDDLLSGNRINDQQDTVEITKKSLGFYIEDNATLYERFIMRGGFRGEWAAFDFNQRRQLSNSQDRSMREAAHEFGLGYKLSSNDLLYANYARSFRFPNSEELYVNKYLDWMGVERGGLNTGIKEQYSHDIEFGIRLNSIPYLSSNLSFFYMNSHNEIYFDPALYINRNYEDETRRMGMELDMKAHLYDERIRPFLHYTLQNAYFHGGRYDDSKIPMVPTNKLVVGCEIEPFKNFNITGLMHYTGSRFMVSDQNNIAAKLDDFVTFDLQTDYTFKNVKIWGAIRNLFDKDYYVYGVTNSAASVYTFYPATDRSAEIGMTITY